MKLLPRIGLVLILCATACTAGKDGAPGAAGEAGAPGTAGGPGTDGAAGPDGVDGADGEDGGSAVTEDQDGDGILVQDDCDDTDPTQGAASLHFLDQDGDGYGIDTVTDQVCGPQSGWAPAGGDCDDADPTVSPGAPEICNDGLDDDCDGLADDDDDDVDLTLGGLFYQDTDGDGYGDDFTATVRACAAASGLAEVGGDCDDSLDTVNPAMAEVCGNGLDDNCSGDADQCGLPTTGDLDDADPTVLLSDATTYDYTGRALAFVDLDADGADELAIGAHGDDDNGSFSGSVALAYGTSGLPSTPSARLQGVSTNDYVGFALSAAGDVDNDGYEDLLVGAYAADTAYLVYGGSSAWSGSTAITDAAGAVLTPDDPVYYFGYSVAGVSDVNADGYADLLVADYGGTSYGGVAYVLAGSASGLTGAVSVESTAWLTITDSEARAYLGDERSLAAGDFDGDGHSDIGLGAWGDDTHGTTRGIAYIFYGPASGSVDETAADVTFDTSSASSSLGLGQGAEGLGDINGDGYDDLALSSAYESSGAGVTYIYYGTSTGWATTPAYTVADVTVTGPGSGDNFIWPRALGDLDADGHDDFAIGGDEYDGGGSNSGAVAVFYGSGSLAGSVAISAADAFVEGDDARQEVGVSIAAGDLDGDGAPEVAIGAPGDDTSTGKVGLFVAAGS